MLIPTCIIKFMELILAVTCLVLHHYSYDLTDIPTLMLCSGTYVGFVIVFSGEIVGEIVSAVADAYVDAWWAASGAALYVGSGYFTLQWWKDVPECPRRTLAQATGTCAIALAALLLLDALLAVCVANRNDDKHTATHGAAPGNT